MIRSPFSVRFAACVMSGFFVLLFLCSLPATAQMVTGADMPGFADAFRLNESDRSKDFSVQEIAVHVGRTSMVNVLWPGEKAELVLHFTNKLPTELKAAGSIEIISYGTSVPPGDVWVPHVFKIADEGSLPFNLDLPPGGEEDLTMAPSIPERFGGYALIVGLQGHGRAFAATLVRILKPDEGRVQFPTYALDTTWDEFMNEGVFTLFQRLGIKGMRMGAAYDLASDPDYGRSTSLLENYLAWSRKHDVTVMLTVSAGEGFSSQPLGRPRPWLSPENKMLDTKDDRAWLPAYDDDFQNWIRQIAGKYGWPKGNVNAMELWNEPWESVSISGWQADIPRYRDIFTHMALGIEAARRESGVKVLVGGTCSSSNARDKLFPDGSDHFLKWLDFVSIHYQALAADPSLEPTWMHRKSPYGPVRVWDTESWIANSEDRIAGVIASMRAQGQSRTAGIFDGNVYESRNIKIGSETYPIVQAWSPAAAVAASQKFIGQRDFKELLFQNGLPWIFVFSGLPAAGHVAPRPDDGTVVIVGDLRKIYEPERTLFRSVDLASDAHLTLANPEGTFHLFDFYGNPVPSAQARIDVPLNGLGYFLRTSGVSGSFGKLLQALRASSIHGYAPVEIVAHDLTAPIDQHPLLRITLTNVLNKPVAGHLHVKLGDLQLESATRDIKLLPATTSTIAFRVTGGKPAESNLYPLSAEFDSPSDGHASHTEDLHVNFITRRTITVDGDLSDWSGVLPQILPGAEIGKNMTEAAWLPFRKFDKDVPNGLATAYLAFDDRYFYFAAKIVDSTPDPGMVRFATRDDDSYFYRDHAIGRDNVELNWPAGVRHFSYRKNFDIPSGSGEHDNVQIAFNVLKNKPWLQNPPGVMPRFITYWDTDYEFALNPVASEFGGGTEIYRLQSPGMPRKHFFPRQPKAPIDGGAVTNGQLVIRREGNSRIVEAAIPWTEMPEVYARIKAGQTVKFSCRVNDDKGPAHELASWRSVSKMNSITFHDDWQSHWSNELEFGAKK